MDRVRHVGSPLRWSWPKTGTLAEDALDLLRVDYEPLPVVSDIEHALRKTPARFAHDGLAATWSRIGRFAMAIPILLSLSRGVRTVRSRHHPRNSCSPMECAVVIAEHRCPATRAMTSPQFYGAVLAARGDGHGAQRCPAKLRHRVPRATRVAALGQAGGVSHVVLMCLAFAQGGRAGEVGGRPA